MKPCPFCGKQPDLSDDDTLYPTGHFWVNDDLGRHYFGYDHPKLKPDPSQMVWGVHCVEIAGGCGAEITGDSRDEAIAKWERRVNLTRSNAAQRIRKCET